MCQEEDKLLWRPGEQVMSKGEVWRVIVDWSVVGRAAPERGVRHEQSVKLQRLCMRKRGPVSYCISIREKECVHRRTCSPETPLWDVETSVPALLVLSLAELLRKIGPSRSTSQAAG